MMSVDSKALHSVYLKLRKNGVCNVCSCRFVSPHFEGFDTKVENKKFADKTGEIRNDTSCTICLDLFNQDVEEIKKLILENDVIDFDSDHFMIALTLPSVCQLRERNICEYLRSEFPNIYDDKIHLPQIGIKEAWRMQFCPSISEIISKTYDAKSDLVIQVVFAFNDNNSCNGSDEKNGNEDGKINGHVENEELSDYFSLPLTVPNRIIRCASVSVRRNSFFLAGRYNKFSRSLSQTPWILADGERKMKSSVEEIISEHLKMLTKAQESRFSSSGREDIDVRMLGNGRPFAVELINAKVVNLSYSVLRSVENEINNVDPQSVLIRDLQMAHRSEIHFLKNGEENKTKDYCVICLVKNIVILKNLIENLPRTSFVIQQKTPLRVLHRRTVATRCRTIYRITAQPLAFESSNGYALLKLNLTTQAGTYVKEFIHGDFGRTFPSISFMFGQLPVDVLALDVMNVEVEWPNALNYGENIH